MKNLLGISKRTTDKFIKISLLAAVNVLATINTIMAQGEPSVENIKKTTEASKDEYANQELMGYVYMVLGFGLVIAIAWFTNSRVQKRRSEKASQRSSQQHHHHTSHDPYYRRRSVAKTH